MTVYTDKELLLVKFLEIGVGKKKIIVEILLTLVSGYIKLSRSVKGKPVSSEIRQYFPNKDITWHC